MSLANCKAKLLIENFLVHVNIGCTKDEQVNKQPLELNIEIDYISVPLGVTSDNIDDTICYDKLIKSIIATLNGRSFHLIEHLTNEIHKIILSYNNLTSVKTTVKKWPKINGFEGSTSFQLQTLLN